MPRLWVRASPGATFNLAHFHSSDFILESLAIHMTYCCCQCNIFPGHRGEKPSAVSQRPLQSSTVMSSQPVKLTGHGAGDRTPSTSMLINYSKLAWGRVNNRAALCLWVFGVHKLHLWDGIDRMLFLFLFKVTRLLFCTNTRLIVHSVCVLRAIIDPMTNCVNGSRKCTSADSYKYNLLWPACHHNWMRIASPHEDYCI